MKHFSFREFTFPKINLDGLSSDVLMDFIYITMKTREYLYNNIDDYFFYSCLDTSNADFDEGVFKDAESVDRFIGLLEPALEDSVFIREIDSDLNDVYIRRCGVNYIIAAQMGFRPTTSNEKFEPSYDSSMAHIFKALDLPEYHKDYPLGDVKRVHNTIRVEWFTRILQQVEDELEKRKIYATVPYMNLDHLSDAKRKELIASINEYIQYGSERSYLCYTAFRVIADEVAEAMAYHYQGTSTGLQDIGRVVQHSSGLPGHIVLADFLSAHPILEYNIPHNSRLRLVHTIWSIGSDLPGIEDQTAVRSNAILNTMQAAYNGVGSFDQINVMADKIISKGGAFNSVDELRHAWVESTLSSLKN